MKKLFGILSGIAFSFMFCFTLLGYAKVTNTLVVDGKAEYTPPDAIYIIDVKQVTASSATFTTSPVNFGYPTTKVLSNVTYSSRNATVTYTVTVVNNSQVDQIFDKIEALESDDSTIDPFDYTNVTATVSPEQGTVVKRGETQDFTITYKYTGRDTNQERNSLYALKFVLDSDDLTQIVSASVTDRFAHILNNELTENVSYILNNREYTIQKEATFNAIDKNMEGTTQGSGWNSTGRYMGNLSGADADDKAILTALFGDSLTFEISGETVPITIMIKEKRVYGTNDLDMVLFITANDLSDRSTYVPVYAVVFSQDETGYWQQIGDIFAGEAQTNNYSGWSGSGSFNTETWRSTAAYYGLRIGVDIEDIMTAYSKQNP